MNVLVIPEDFRKDQYVLQPLVATMLAACGRPRANVRICRDPLLRGVTQALRWDQIKAIIERYAGMTDLFLLCVDRDGVEGRRAALSHIEKQASQLLSLGRLFLAENAWQEIEVWVLAGQRLPRGWKWDEIRREVHPKERYFLPFARERGLLHEPGEGRRTLAREAAQRYDQVRKRCPEDVAALEERIRTWMQAPS